MKLKDNFIIRDYGAEQVMVPTGNSGFSGLVRNNGTAAFIVDCLKKETSKEEILEAMAERYDAPREVLEKGIDEVLSKLRSIRALDE